VLIGLANHAGPDGKDTFPSEHTLVRYTCLSKRTVQTALDRLEEAGLIRPCDPAVVAAKIKRADRRPQGWDLAMGLVRDDLDDEDLAALEHGPPRYRHPGQGGPGPDCAWPRLLRDALAHRPRGWLTDAELLACQLIGAFKSVHRTCSAILVRNRIRCDLGMTANLARREAGPSK
jgi:hypothetical protein